MFLFFKEVETRKVIKNVTNRLQLVIMAFSFSVW